MARYMLALALASVSAAAAAQGANQAYWEAKATCWSDLAKTEDAQGDNHGTARVARSNADRIRSALKAGREPAGEASIFKQAMLPAENSRHGRPAWRRDILTIDAALDRYKALGCKTALSACLEVARESVYENMEETQGARWNHGRPEIDHALRLVAKSKDDVARCEAPPEPIAAERPPEPIPLPQPEPTVLAQRALPVELLFDFDSARLTPAGSNVIATTVDELKTTATPILHVVGHTDRFGSDSYNQALSLRRAEAVKAAILAHVPGAQVTTQGAGSASPMVHCTGKQDPATVACLAPNRRVVLQVLSRQSTSH